MLCWSGVIAAVIAVSSLSSLLPSPLLLIITASYQVMTEQGYSGTADYNKIREAQADASSGTRRGKNFVDKPFQK